MKTRIWLLSCLCALSLATPLRAADEPWTATQQPDLAQQLGAAPKLNAVNFAEPVKSTRMDMNILVPVPGPKPNWHMLQFYIAPQVATTIVIANLADGTTKQVQTDGTYGFHLSSQVITRGRLYLSLLGPHQRQRMCYYDPVTGEFHLDSLVLPKELMGESHPMSLGTDGNLYLGGGHPSGAACFAKVDPDTNKIEFIAPVGPSHGDAGCWCMSIAADDTHVYLSSGKVPWHLVAYDRKTGKSETLFTTETLDGVVKVRQLEHGVTAKVTNAVGTNGATHEYFLYHGKAIPMEGHNPTPPWPEPARDSNKRPSAPEEPEVSLAAATTDHEGNATIWYRLPANKPESEKKATDGKKRADDDKSKEAAKPNESSDDEIAVIVDDKQLQAQGWAALRFKVPIFPIAAYRLTELPDGRLFGTAGAYTGMFMIDPATGKSEHLGLIHVSHYATVLNKGKIYMSGYPSAPLFEYDPNKPWTAATRVSALEILDEADPRANPRRVTRLSDSGCHKMYDGAVGAGGDIYMGGRWYRDGNNGGVGWWNPDTKVTGGTWRDLSNYKVNYMAAVDGGKTIVLSTTRVEDIVLHKPKPAQGALFFLDDATKKFVGTLDVLPDIKGTGHIVAVSPHHIMGWTENPQDESKKSSIIYGVDTTTRKVCFTKIVPSPLPANVDSNQMENSDFRIGPDGWVWTFLDETVLVKINPANADIVPIGKLEKAGRIAFSGKDLYLSGLAAIRKVSNVIK